MMRRPFTLAGWNAWAWMRRKQLMVTREEIPRGHNEDLFRDFHQRKQRTSSMTLIQQSTCQTGSTQVLLRLPQLKSRPLILLSKPNLEGSRNEKARASVRDKFWAMIGEHTNEHLKTWVKSYLYIYKRRNLPVILMTGKARNFYCIIFIIYNDSIIFGFIASFSPFTFCNTSLVSSTHD